MSDSFNVAAVENGQLVNNRQPAPSEGDLGGIANDFSTFLTLLTTQLQNQDPLDPTDTNEFTNQLVSFSQVEQQIRSNDQLENIANQLAASNLATQASFLGQTARVEHDTGTEEGNGIRWHYQLDDTPASNTLQITDESGAVVLQVAGEIREGFHTFEWNGLDANGQRVPEGQYSLEVVAADDQGSQIGSATFVEDEIRSINPSTGDLVIADESFDQSDLLRLIANGF